MQVPKRYQWQWNHPWTRKAKHGIRFRRWLNSHGLLSPHFTVAEARCADGTNVTGMVKVRARNHAFDLERLRHELGDQPIPIVSWYRTPAHNKAVHGAAHSRHMKGDATDHPKSWVDRTGRERVQRAAERVFVNGGVGTYPGGSMHFDSRGVKARWSDWVRT
jgi:hypothetical protein